MPAREQVVKKNRLVVKYSVPYWRAGMLVLSWLILGSGLMASVQDRRQAIAEETANYRAQHFPDGHMPPKHDWRRQPTATAAAASSPATQTLEAPGGVGYGYFFAAGSLLWTNCSIADYYVDAPTYAVGVSNLNLLYLTSTCRAQLGTESLISYDGNSEAQFWIYDWSQKALGNNPWTVMMDLPTLHPQYLTTRPDELTISRQMAHIRNGTYYLGYSNGLYNWQNETFLFDFAKGNWDLIYTTNYTTTNLTNNIPVAGGEYDGSWGPIVETFGDYTNTGPVGFDLIRLFQDGGNPSWLGPSDSYIDYSTNWILETQAPNTSYSVVSGTNNTIGALPTVGSLCVSASTAAATFTLSPAGGLISSNWVSTPYGNLWDKIVVGLTPGNYTITFSPVPGMFTPAPQSFAVAANMVTNALGLYIPGPVLQSTSLAGTTLTSVWSAPTNSSWQVQCTTNVTQTNWSNWGNPVVATNGLVTVSDSVNSNPLRFYRLVAAP